MAAPPVLQAQRVSHGYGSHAVLDDISLSFHQGELVSLLGPNGCGKTTFLKILLGLLRPSSGTVLFQGKSIRSISPRQYARQVAYVPQIHRTAFPYTVEDVVAMGRIPHQSLWLRSSVKHLVWGEEALAKLEIAHLRKRAYTEISGGERQLTLIARALAQGASTIIMDEPTATLSTHEVERLRGLILELKERGTAIVFVTHRLDEVKAFCDTYTILRDGIRVGSGAVVYTPLEELVRLMIGRPLFDEVLEAQEAGPTVLEVESLTTTGWSIAGRSVALRDVSLTARAGEILGIAGLVGAGRTELALSLMQIKVNERFVDINTQTVSEKSTNRAGRSAGGNSGRRSGWSSGQAACWR